MRKPGIVAPEAEGMVGSLVVITRDKQGTPAPAVMIDARAGTLV
jgi:hypothetical protein